MMEKINPNPIKTLINNEWEKIKEKLKTSERYLTFEKMTYTIDNFFDFYIRLPWAEDQNLPKYLLEELERILNSIGYEIDSFKYKDENFHFRLINKMIGND